MAAHVWVRKRNEEINSDEHFDDKIKFVASFERA